MTERARIPPIIRGSIAIEAVGIIYRDLSGTNGGRRAI